MRRFPQQELPRRSMSMKKTMIQERLGLKKATLSTLLAVLAICGPLSVSAQTFDLSSGTTAPNKVTEDTATAADKTSKTTAIGFNNNVTNGAIAIGSNNKSQAKYYDSFPGMDPSVDQRYTTVIGQNNSGLNGSIVIGYGNDGNTTSIVVGRNNVGSGAATVIGLNARSAEAVVIGNQASGGIFNISTKISDPTGAKASTAVGNNATALVGTAIGANSKAYRSGVALGSGANALYGGTALGRISATAENTYSPPHAGAVALGDESYADRSSGTYGYVPLTNTADLTLSDSQDNDLALANQMGGDVPNTVKNLYDTYGKKYTEWKSLASNYEKTLMDYNKQVAKMNSTTYATEADRAEDYATLQKLDKVKTDAVRAFSAFNNAAENKDLIAAITAKDNALSTFKATASAVSVGRAATDTQSAITRQITNLAAGTADTDAVNVAQLKQVKTYADGIANTVKELTDKVSSGNRDFAGDDKSKVSVKIGETMEITGGAAADNLSDDNIGVVAKGKNGVSIKLSKDLKGLNTAEFNNSITVGTGDNKTVITGDSIRTGNTTINNNGLTVVNEDSSKNITIQNDNINMGGNAIHNVGEATEAGDAINKGQFDKTINNLSTGMSDMNSRIGEIGRDVNRVGAGAAALASLHPLDFDPDDKASFAVGFGSYKSEHAAALGAFYRPNENTMVNLAATVGNNDNMYSAGVSFKIGSSSPYANMSKSEMAVKLEELTAQNQKIESQNQELNERLAKLEALVASK